MIELCSLLPDFPSTSPNTHGIYLVNHPPGIKQSGLSIAIQIDSQGVQKYPQDPAVTVTN